MASSKQSILRLFTFRFAVSLVCFVPCAFAGHPYTPFIITVKDSDTGKPIPLVELTTVNKISYVTDSNGQVAFLEPGLMNVGDVYFRVNAPHGYHDPNPDGFGYRGRGFRPTPGGSAEFTLNPDPNAGDPPVYSGLKLFRLHHPYTVTAGTYQPFEIIVRDTDTGRGVPLVELRTAEGLRYYTDSAGRIAFFEPHLMDRDVFFHVKSYGYAAPAGGGVTLKTTSGKSAEVALQRTHIAERLYRITGEGIYRDSVLLERPVPLAHPLLSGKVVGQDTVAMAEYKGRLFWLWGDTERPSYPLGNFKTSSGTSLVPGQGGLDPSVGVDLTYYVDGSGFSKQMFPRSDAGVIWMNTLVSVDDYGTERLVASYAVIKGEAEDERGVAVFNDTTETFETLTVFQPSHRIVLSGQAHKKDGYVYVNCPYPTVRVPATLSGFQNPALYEAFTCLAAGTSYDGADSQVERDAANKLVWDWKPNTSPINDSRWDSLVKAGLVTPDDVWNRLSDVETGNHVRAHGGSAGYNPYKDCWIMVINQEFGNSYLGEIWIAASRSPEGPWTKARNVVTHKSPEDVYTFYNVAYHSEFNQNNGRHIYFEGTYVTTYSGNPNPTPGYDYNQVMYRIDLSDERLKGIWPLETSTRQPEQASLAP